MTEQAFNVAIIGDHFMRPNFFLDAFDRLEGVNLRYRTQELDWPDTPMVHDVAGGELAGLKEFLGDPDELLPFIDGADVLVNRLAPVNSGMLARLPQLKLIAVARGRALNIDMAACRAHGIPVVTVPGISASAVAEFTIGAILAETRLITRGHTAWFQGDWRVDLQRAETTGDELPAQTVGIVGYGHIGTRVVRLLKPFGCEVLVCDPYVGLAAEDVADGVRQVDLDTVLRCSDVVSVHARLHAEATGLIGAQEFARMKDDVIFINTACGPLVDYDALYQGLTSGKVRSAFLDTFSQEPPALDWPLLALPNVTVTPHIAGASLTAVRIAARMVAEELRRFIAGEPLLNPV